MADYRKSLMDMTPEERAEVAPGFVPSDDVEKPLSVKGAEFGLSMTPVGTAMEVAEELSSDSPSWLNIGLAVAPDLLGLGPVADPLMKAIKGTKFKTAKGSTYEVTDGNTTVRNKAARPEHPGESGVQPQSKKTIYMPRAEVEKFAGIHQNPDIGTEFIPTGENTAALRYTEDYGPRKAGEIVPGTEVTFTLDPEVGLNPVEILDFRNPRGIHFGNEIIEVESNIPKVSRGTGAIDTTKGSIEAAGLTDEAIDAWRKANATSEEFRKALKGRNPELQDLANKIDDPDSPITVEDYRVRADEIRPIRKVTDVPKPATYKEVVSALNAGKRKKPMIGLNAEIPDGDIITARLDIDAYTDYDVWVPTLTHPDLKTVYKPTVVLKDVSFIDESSSALKKAKGVAQGKAKAPFAVMTGKYQNMGNDEAYEYATSVFDSDEWVQAGYDPTKRGFFYDRADGQPILAGDEVIQVGHLVLVKNATKGDAKAFSFNEGGMAMDEQMDAIFKSSRTGYAEGGEVGAAPDTTIGVDPVSGNEVPMGATPEEVRDDIPAQLSEGEYVVPADVVRFYGVKFFEDLRTQAKQGYAEMDQNGRIGGEPVGQEASGMEMVEPEDDLPFDISELQIVDDETGMYEGGLAGYADGGLPAAPTQPPVPMNPFSPTGATAGYEIKEYVNDAGEVMFVQFMNGQPMTFIPQGFKPKGSVAEEVAEETAATAPTDNQSSNDEDDYDPTLKQQEAKTAVDWNKATPDEFATAIKGLGVSGAVGTIAGGIVGGPIGMAVGIGAKSAARYKAYDMISGIDYQLESMSSDDPNRALLESQKQKLEEFVSTGDDGKSDDGIIGKSGIFGGKSSMYEGLQDISGDGRVTFQDTWLGDLLGGDGQLGVQGPSLEASRKGARRGEIASVSDKAITVVEKGTNKSVSVSAKARDKSDAGSGVSSASKSASAAQAYGKAATGSKYILNPDGSTRKVTTYDPDKVKAIKFNPGER